MRMLQFLAIAAALGTSLPRGLAQDSSSFSTLYSFTGQGDGGNPQAGVVFGKNGVLYGTTNSGGTSNAGTVFKLAPPASPGGAWTETVLHDFTGGSGDGANPSAGVVFGRGGVLYGTTVNGGTSGTVFSLTPPASPSGAWTETVLHEFTGTPDGANPYAGVVIGRGGVLYGTTSSGADYYFGCCFTPGGTVFSLTPPASPGGAWTEALLSTFGSEPFPLGFGLYSSVVIGRGGVLYGSTKEGPCSHICGSGAVFSLTPPASPGGGWTGTAIYGPRGPARSPSPVAALVVGENGVLYGTAEFALLGGVGNGTVFSLTPPVSPGMAWTETVLYTFAGLPGDGANPTAPVVIGSGGVLYGTTEKGGTSNGGTVFSLTPPASPRGAWTETVLHSFTGGRDGAAPLAGLVIGKTGVLYGTTSKGGTSLGGTVFALRPYAPVPWTAHQRSARSQPSPHRLCRDHLRELGVFRLHLSRRRHGGDGLAPEGLRSLAITNRGRWCGGPSRLRPWLARISHGWSNDVAHALVRRTRACRVETKTCLGTLQACGQSVESGRRHECRRGTQECVRHVMTMDVRVLFGT